MAYNFLVVDDSATVRAVFEKTLRLAGLPVGEVHHAGDGSEALAVLGRAWVDLVLTDLNMPGMNGYELVERMRAEGLLAQTPVVVVTTEGSEPRIAALRAAGVRAYVRKPFTPEQIRETVQSILGGPA